MIDLVARLVGLVHRARFRLARRCAKACDEGFILLESMIAISVITIIMGAIGAEFVNGIASTSQQRAEQGAVQIADSQMEDIRALHPSDLLVGRDAASVAAQFATASASVLPWLANMSHTTADPTATSGAGANAAVPTSPAIQTPGSTAYTVNDYLGTCAIPNTDSTDCVDPASLSTGVSAISYLRAVVAVTWTGPRCNSTVCAYSTSTLISTAGDQTFRINSAAYSAPSIVALAPQTVAVAVGDTVNRQLAVQTGTGVPPYTWALFAGSFPAGLAISAAGLISGTVGGPSGTFSTTIQVTDAFQRTDTQTVTWTVRPAIALTDPGPQASTTATAVNLSLNAIGGFGPPYTFSDPNTTLPSGLSISSAGLVSGMPSSVGSYAVKITVTDSSTTRSATGTFTWTVSYPPIAASNPGTPTNTQGAATSLQLSASGGDGVYTWSDPTSSLPAGLSINSAGLISGTPTTTGTKAVSLTVKDPGAGSGTAYTVTTSFSWSIVAPPSVTSPGTQSSSVTSPISLQLTTTCPNSPCTYAVKNGPGNLSVSSTGRITGTVAGPVTTYSAVTVTATDAQNVITTSTPFTWLVYAAPTLATPRTQSTARRGVASLDMNAYANNGTAPYTWSASGLPSWLSISTSTGVISGTAPNGTTSTSGITVTLIDRAGAQATSGSFTWNVSDLASSFGDHTTIRNTSGTFNLNNSTTGGSGNYAYTLSGQPSWLTLSGSTLTVAPTNVATNSTTKAPNIKITITDSAGASVTTAINWYITDLSLGAVPTTVSTAQNFTLSTNAGYYTNGGAKPYSFKSVGLVPGLTLTTDGTVTGTTTTKGTFSVVVFATDNIGATVITTINWTVY